MADKRMLKCNGGCGREFPAEELTIVGSDQICKECMETVRNISRQKLDQADREIRSAIDVIDSICAAYPEIHVPNVCTGVTVTLMARYQGRQARIQKVEEHAKK